MEVLDLRALLRAANSAEHVQERAPAVVRELEVVVAEAAVVAVAVAAVALEYVEEVVVATVLRRVRALFDRVEADADDWGFLCRVPLETAR